MEADPYPVGRVAQFSFGADVYGMPKAAVEIGAVQEIAPLSQIAGCILKCLA